MKKIVILIFSLLVITSCWTIDNNKQDNAWTGTEKESRVEDKKASDDKLEKELMSDEDFKMHFSSKDEWQEIEAIMQKKGKNMSMEILKMTGIEDVPENFKMKKMILKDGSFYTNMKIWEKDIWLKSAYDQEKQEESWFVDVKKLLKKLKKENAKKESKEIDGKNYDCYSSEFLEDSTMCFEWKELKYMIDKDWYKMKIIELTDKLDNKAFETPSDDKITSQQDFMKVMMETMWWEK